MDQSNTCEGFDEKLFKNINLSAEQRIPENCGLVRLCINPILIVCCKDVLLKTL